MWPLASTKHGWPHIAKITGHDSPGEPATGERAFLSLWLGGDITANPWYLAKNASIDEFDAAYTPDMAGYEPEGTGALGGALVNTDLAARLHIAHRLLDDGANAAGRDGQTNLLHIYFGTTSHDIEAEAPLLKRLIDGGADLNARHPKWGTPLLVLLRNNRLDDDGLGPFYDVIFSTPGIDFDVPASRPKEKQLTLAQRIEAWADYRPEMYRAMVSYGR